MITRVVRALVGLRLAKHADAVGDGLGAGHGRSAVGEGPGGVEQRHPQQQPAALVAERHLARGGGHVAEVAERRLDQPGDDQHRHVGDEEVGGDGEDPARLPQAAQVAAGDRGPRTPPTWGRPPGRRLGTAEMMASVPAATETATVIV